MAAIVTINVSTPGISDRTMARSEDLVLDAVSATGHDVISDSGDDVPPALLFRS
ncbi:MAG: hypothetical protein ABI170_06880 [Microbacteriaceae bacterium]